MATSIQRNNWIFERCKNILDDKEYLLKSCIMQMLNKTVTMFKYNNLPEYMTEKDIEIITQVNGYCVWKKVDDKLYVFYGGLGGEPNPYYLPTIAIIANPYLKYTASLTIDEECVVMTNDYLYQGVMPLFNKYASLLVEAEISLKYAILNARIPKLVQADNENTYNSAKTFFEKIYSGEGYGIIANKEFFEGIDSQEFYRDTYVKPLIEAIQYIKGSWYNEIGINSAFNMKREAINSAEAVLNEDLLYPTIDTMLKCRQMAIDKVNKMFGTNISVELNSIWARNRLEDELSLKQKEAEFDSITEESSKDYDKEITENEDN